MRRVVTILVAVGVLLATGAWTSDCASEAGSGKPAGPVASNTPKSPPGRPFTPSPNPHPDGKSQRIRILISVAFKPFNRNKDVVLLYDDATGPHTVRQRMAPMFAYAWWNGPGTPSVTAQAAQYEPGELQIFFSSPGIEGFLCVSPVRYDAGTVRCKYPIPAGDHL